MVEIFVIFTTICINFQQKKFPAILSCNTYMYNVKCHYDENRIFSIKAILNK